MDWNKGVNTECYKGRKCLDNKMVQIIILQLLNELSQLFNTGTIVLTLKARVDDLNNVYGVDSKQHSNTFRDWILGRLD